MEAIGVETVLFPELACPLPWRGKHLTRIIRDRKAKGVVAFNQLDRAFSLRAAAAAGVPSFIHLGNQHSFRGSWLWRNFKENYYGHTLRNFAKLIVCVSPVVRKELLERFHMPPERTQLLLNGIDVKKHQPIEPAQRLALRRELGIQDDEVMLINVGRIDRQKGHDILADALAPINLAERKAKVVVIGGASETPRASTTEDFFSNLKSQVARHNLGDRLIFAGWRNDVPALLQAADAYVHSARWEGFPLAPLEAMAASKACVWTDCSGHPEGFVEGTHGWVAKKENPASLGKAIENMLATTPEQRLQMGLACRELAHARYDIEKVGARFVELVETHSLN